MNRTSILRPAPPSAEVRDVSSPTGLRLAAGQGDATNHQNRRAPDPSSARTRHEAPPVRGRRCYFFCAAKCSDRGHRPRPGRRSTRSARRRDAESLEPRGQRGRLEAEERGRSSWAVDAAARALQRASKVVALAAAHLEIRNHRGRFTRCAPGRRQRPLQRWHRNARRRAPKRRPAAIDRPTTDAPSSAGGSRRGSPRPVEITARSRTLRSSRTLPGQSPPAQLRDLLVGERHRRTIEAAADAAPAAAPTARRCPQADRAEAATSPEKPPADSRGPGGSGRPRRRPSGCGWWRRRCARRCGACGTRRRARRSPPAGRAAACLQSSGSSPTSSRNSVPPCAASKRPTRSRVAPENAPRTWPKSSLSASSRGMAAQLSSTNGPAARRLWR